MSFRIAFAAFASVLVLAPQSPAMTAAPQAVNPAQPRSQASLAIGNSLQQVSVTIAHLRRALGSVNVEKWKAPGDVKRTTAGDVDSMQRDITDTLPGLINTALGDPAKISPAFAVYRNVDALYDVLLRVSETAQIAGAHEADTLEEQRANLESSRSQLGAALLQSSQAQDAEVSRLRNAVIAATPPPQPTKTVVDDGPATKSKSRKRTHKPATTPAKPQ